MVTTHGSFAEQAAPCLPPQKPASLTNMLDRITTWMTPPGSLAMEMPTGHSGALKPVPREPANIPCKAVLNKEGAHWDPDRHVMATGSDAHVPYTYTMPGNPGPATS